MQGRETAKTPDTGNSAVAAVFIVAVMVIFSIFLMS